MHTRTFFSSVFVHIIYFSAKTFLVDVATNTAHTQNVIAFYFYFGFVRPILCEIFEPRCFSSSALNFN